MKGSANAFVTKVAAGGTGLAYSSYLGGTSSGSTVAPCAVGFDTAVGDTGKGIAVDAGGNAYVTGITQSSDFPTTADAVQAAFGGGTDAFVSKINPGLTGAASLVYSSYLGGSGTDEGYGVATDSSGNAYLTGLTNSTNFPTVNAFQPNLSPGLPNTDAFVSKLSTPTPPAVLTAVSTLEYALPSSDGITWKDLDANRLSLSITPAVNSVVILTGNADLWTNTAGFNQDLAITINGVVQAWKESGGFAGTFSPNAAFIQAAFSLAAGTTYVVKLQWKTNKPAAGATIYAGAGPIGTNFSPTRLTAELLPATPPTVATVVTTQQYHLIGSDGSTWRDVDSTNLSFTVTPSVSGVGILGGNADLWTANAGVNQDLAITVNGAVVAWKESGGFAGTFSPNAAFVLATIPMTAATAYTVKLQWKTNKPAGSATIYAGAGPIASKFSPTRLTLQYVAAGTGVTEKVSTKQYNQPNSNGSSWVDLDATTALSMTLTPSTNCTVILNGNTDLWTANAGINQDIGISVSGTIVAWKESGGFAGTFSPNAAMVQTVVQLLAGTPYVVKLQWKANKPATGATIYAGAGPIGTQFSPSRLTAHLAACG